MLLEDFDDFFESIRLGNSLDVACFNSGLNVKDILRFLEEGKKGQDEFFVSFWEEYRISKLFKSEIKKVNFEDLGIF